ncbi:MAG: hypothetical protein JWP89_1208 [Schlesneria sp.]|nr:hypothetical protein [Schlesneria sp.]
MAELYLEEDGIVSLWIGQRQVASGSNFLRDQFGIDFYDPDNQECIVEDSVTSIADLISQLSYSESFQGDAVEAAERLGITSGIWVMGQYDYAYDLLAAGVTAVPVEPVFIGKFNWHE